MWGDTGGLSSRPAQREGCTWGCVVTPGSAGEAESQQVLMVHGLNGCLVPLGHCFTSTCCRLAQAEEVELGLGGTELRPGFSRRCSQHLWGTRGRRSPTACGLAWHCVLHVEQGHAGHPSPGSEGDKNSPCKMQGSKMD